MKIFLLIILYTSIIILCYLLYRTTQKPFRGKVYQSGYHVGQGNHKSYFSCKLHSGLYLTNLSTCITRYDWHGYELFLRIGTHCKKITFAYIYHNIGYTKMVVDGVAISLAVFLQKLSAGIMVHCQVKNLTSQSKKIEVIVKINVPEPILYLTKNIYQRTTYYETKSRKEHIRFFGLKTQFYKKEQELGQIGTVQCLPSRIEKFACILGGDRLGYRSTIEIENVLQNTKQESVRFEKRYLNPKRKAILLHYMKKSEKYTFSIEGKEKYFSRNYFEDSFFVNHCDPYYPIFVMQKWTKETAFLSQLLLDMGTGIQLIPLPKAGKLTDYHTVMAVNLNVQNALLKKKEEFAVKDRIKKWKPLVLSTGIEVEGEEDLTYLDRMNLYPATYMYTTVQKKELKNYMLREKITKIDHYFVKGDLRDKSTSMKDFFIIKIECDDLILMSLVNDLLPRKIMQSYKKDYHFQSLYEYVFHQDIDGLYANQYLENMFPLLQHKEYARLYCYLIKKVIGVEIVGDLLRNVCGADHIPYLKIKVYNTVIEKYQKDKKCIIKCNQIMYQNIGVFKIKKNHKD